MGLIFNIATLYYFKCPIAKENGKIGKETGKCGHYLGEKGQQKVRGRRMFNLKLEKGFQLAILHTHTR